MRRPGLFASLWLMALSGCGADRVVSPDSMNSAVPLTERQETAHYVFHFAPGDSVDFERQEAFHDWVVPRLEVSLPQKIQYYKYLSGDHLTSLTGHVTNGLAEPERFAVHSISSWSAHESVHVYSALVGRPSDFFNEGLAVALAVDPLAGRFEGTFTGEPVHQWARGNLSRLMPVDDIVTTEAFRSVDEALGYQEAGSFLGFLLDEEGFGPMLAFFQQGQRGQGLDAIRTLFFESFGFSLAEAERRWYAFLRFGASVQPVPVPSGRTTPYTLGSLD